MASLLGNISKRIEIATKPPTKIIDRTLPRKQITLENLEDYIKEAKEFYGMGKPGDMNIAVVGAKGVGKSSLINGLIGAHDDDKEAATVGKSNENPVRYRNRLMEAMVLWEMPAGGERGHPSLTFFHDHKLYAFDWILIVSDRFHRLDFEVARSASRLNRRCTFVRTKCDLAVQTIIQRSGIAEINVTPFVCVCVYERERERERERGRFQNLNCGYSDVFFGFLLLAFLRRQSKC
ncbi:hypothetical protein KP509_21G087400 [Ceratopteris richardii]|uniref:IRG-type G domain-containing protein n=1 Tax=Ceratopteris richardii TaxID=49495 RepID=A0A8T2SC59_CERRI|nr:hypothetical protein KP509_21G087400 [Ceratopteris richardii]